LGEGGRWVQGEYKGTLAGFMCNAARATSSTKFLFIFFDHPVFILVFCLYLCLALDGFYFLQMGEGWGGLLISFSRCNNLINMVCCL
jgi:hypothetical protein